MLTSCDTTLLNGHIGNTIASAIAAYQQEPYHSPARPGRLYHYGIRRNIDVELHWLDTTSTAADAVGREDTLTVCVCVAGGERHLSSLPTGSFAVY